MGGESGSDRGRGRMNLGGQVLRGEEVLSFGSCSPE